MNKIRNGTYFCAKNDYYSLIKLKRFLFANVQNSLKNLVFSRCAFCSFANADDSPSDKLKNDFEDDAKSVFAHLKHKENPNRLKYGPANSKVLTVSIIGAPNAGKSTLINQLVGWKLMSFSGKVHTTRKNALAVLTEENTQVVFTDTPGMIDKNHMHKHHLEESLLTDPEKSLCNADVVAVVVDASNKWTRNVLDKNVLKLLHLNSHIPSFLILNKIDKIKKRAMLVQNTRTLTEGVVAGSEIEVKTETPQKNCVDLETILSKYDPSTTDGTCNKVSKVSDKSVESDSSLTAPFDELNVSDDGLNNDNIGPLKDRKTDAKLKRKILNRLVRNKCGWPHFRDVFTISSLNGEGIGSLKQYLLNSAQPGNWLFDSKMVTDQDPQDVVLQLVRAKLLDNLRCEIPYELQPIIVFWEMDEIGMLSAVIDIITHTNREYFAVLGKGGSRITKMAIDVKQDMMNYFRCDMKLKLQAKLKKNK